MRVRALVSFASPIICPAAGEVFDIPKEQALDWIKAGLVQPVEPEVEEATLPAPERAISRKGKR